MELGRNGDQGGTAGADPGVQGLKSSLLSAAVRSPASAKEGEDHRAVL